MKRLAYFLGTYLIFNPYIYPFVNFLETRGFLDKFVKYYDESTIDFPPDWNLLPTQIEAKIGLVQLDKYEDVVKTRIKSSLKWIKFLKDTHIKFLPHIEGATYSHCVGIVKDREKWINIFKKKGIQLGILIEYSIPYMKAYKKFKKGEYPISKFYSKHTINFPNWREFDERTIKNIKMSQM